MLCIAGPLSASGLLGEAPGEPNIPQPNMGVPTAGDLTLAFLGDAGVAGRVDMMREEVLRLGQLVLVAGAVRRATKGMQQQLKMWLLEPVANNSATCLSEAAVNLKGIFPG